MATCKGCDRWVAIVVGPNRWTRESAHGVCVAYPPTPIPRDDDNPDLDPAGQQCAQVERVTSRDRLACVWFKPHTPKQGELNLDGGKVPRW